ncbi:MAG: aminoacyl--tRNA ligase-related protein [bacterium]|nr:aminoacyl--tRNA ligase-related protein [bacterium]
MLQSKLFTKTRKEAPKNEESKNARLLIRGGFVEKLSAGVYSYLPLGWRVIGRICTIIREEMNAIGAEEMMMPALVAREYWQKSGRWETDVMYKVGDEQKFGLGWTHEEVMTAIAAHFISSYQDLPRAAYQIQTKFRNEPRARSGLLRGREFLMKDLYSFHVDQEDLCGYYDRVIEAYWKILRCLGLERITKLTEAAGGDFTKEYTHEFQVFSDAGEDTVIHCGSCDFAQNKEIALTLLDGPCPKCGGKLQESSAIEVANVFKLGTRYSEPFGLSYTAQNGEKKPVVMGSYGIGPSRLLGTIVEVMSDEKGLVWPESVAPFTVHLLALGKVSADEIYATLLEKGIEVLYDDRDISPGQKLVEADFLGMPYRAVVSEKTAGKVELKRRVAGEAELVTPEALAKILQASS